LSDPLATKSVLPSQRPADHGFHWLIWMAELGGTGVLVLGALSAAALNLAPGSPVAEAIPSASLRLLTTGLMVGAIVTGIAVSPLGKLSGAHINPAITAAFAVSGQMAAHDVIGYLVAQVTGALAGALAFRALWGSTAHSVGGGVTHPSISTPLALGLEAGMTALLVAVIFYFLSRERLARWTPMVICPVLALIIWKVAPYTGASLNPARSAGPAVIFGDLSDLWLYCVAPVAGALAVAMLWRGCLPSARPVTAKLFHDPRYPCSLASELPAMPPAALAKLRLHSRSRSRGRA
jgi:aquaporin Z